MELHGGDPIAALGGTWAGRVISLKALEGPAEAAVARGIDAFTTPAPATTGSRLRSRFLPVLGAVLLLMGVSAIAASALGRDEVGTTPVAVLGSVEVAAVRPAPSAPPADLALGSTAPSTLAPTPPPSIAALPPAEELVGAAALALLPIDPAVRLSGWELRFLPGRDGVRALTFPRDRRIEVYVREGDTPESLVRVLAHELGHAVDVQDNDADDRARWRAARGAGPEVPWWPDGTTYDFDTLAGDFAEAYAAWLVGSESVSRVGGPFTPEQLALVAELVG